MQLSRRAFMTQTTALSTAALLHGTKPAPSAAAPTRQPEPLPIVDTHQHLWDLTKFKLPWLDGAPAVLKRSYVMQDYLAATAGLNVTRAVYMEVDVAPDLQVAEAEHLLSICRAADSPTVAAVISGRPNSSGFRDYILKYRDQPAIQGVRQVLHAPEAKAGLCLEPQFVKSVQLLGELGKSFDLCMRPTELSDAVRLVHQCPQTRFIVDHCGNADPLAFVPEAARNGKSPEHTADGWKRSMADLARRDRVICKISGIVARAPQGDWKSDLLAPIVNFCLDTFGPERVVFGGDWPVCLLGATYRRWVESLREIVAPRPLDHQRQLFAENAVRFYSLQK